MQEPRDIDLVDLIGTLWQRMRFIATVTSAVALVALVVSLLLPKTYQSTAQILVVRPAAGDDIGRAHEVPFRTFEAVISNWQSFVETIEKLELRENGKLIQPEQLMGNVKVRVLPDIDIVQVDVWMPDAKLAQQVNQFLVELGLKRYHEFTLTETAEASGQLETMAQQAEDEFKASNGRWRDFMMTAQLGQLEEHMKVLAGAMKEATERLQLAIATKATEQAHATLYSQSVSERTPRLELEGSYRMAPEVISSLLGKSVTDAVQISTQQQTGDPTYFRAESEMVVSRAELAGAESTILALNDRLASLTEDFTVTEKLFNDRTAERKALEAEVTARQTAYESIRKERAVAAVNVTTRGYSLRMLSSPSISDKKASPRISLNVLSAAFLGLLVSTVWVLAETYLRRRAD